VNPLAQALTQWLAAFANGALALDPATRERIARLDGRSIVLSPDPPADTVTIRFVGSRIVAESGSTSRPTVVVRGPPAALLEALARGRFGAEVTIEGDELTLAEFAESVRGLRPDFATPLARLVGRDSAEGLVGLLELGLQTADRVLRDLAAEGERLARSGAGRQFLTRAELDDFLARRHTAALHLDRLAARIERLERRASDAT
jgi:ubiquinone biosynthesis protein UbiJ